MARYIDADALIEKMVLGEYIFADTPFQKGVNANTEFWVSEIKQIPTADVVPKSEVARLQEDVDRLNEINEGLVKELSELRKQIELDKRSQEIDKIVRRRLGDFL